MFKKILLSILFVTISLGANDFSADDNCKALWRVEDGALTTDSKGTNTLTSVGTPTADEITYKEGSASCYINDVGEYFHIADADLDAGFPLKNGDSNKKISVCFWLRVEGFPVSGPRVILSKFSEGRNSFDCRFVKGANWTFKIGIGHSGGIVWEWIDHGSTITTDIWYHVGVTFQDSDKSYKIRIWDDNAGALLGGAEVTGNSTNNINVEDGVLYMMGYPNYSFGGWRDEVVVFNDILTSGEIDQIRAGTYGADGAEDGAQVIIVEEE